MEALRRSPPEAIEMLRKAASGVRPLAVVLAGHNGSGKSTLWNDRIADSLRIPLINADRLTMSILPFLEDGTTLRPWAMTLRDQDERWQRVSQAGVQQYLELAKAQHLAFAYETVFSYLQKQPDGSYKSKLDTITGLQEAGYYVVLLFVGLSSAKLSSLRVANRRLKGGHDVPEAKLLERFPRTQEAIRQASRHADMTLMFDNSRERHQAFTLVRAQLRDEVRYDCRDDRFSLDHGLRAAAVPWLSIVAPR